MRRIWKDEEIPVDWRTSIIVPIFEKGNKKEHKIKEESLYEAKFLRFMKKISK